MLGNHVATSWLACRYPHTLAVAIAISGGLGRVLAAALASGWRRNAAHRAVCQDNREQLGIQCHSLRMAISCSLQRGLMCTRPGCPAGFAAGLRFA
jgi:hypothetical protein